LKKTLSTGTQPDPMLRVGVIGASGRMGSEVCRAVEAQDDLELAVRIEHGDELAELDGAVDVAVEFTVPSSVEQNVRFCLDKKLPTVVGATGLSDDTLTDLGASAEAAGVGLFVAPNFAVGAVLMMRFAAAAAPFFERAEIVERHHENKVDSPSGTALRTVSEMNSARREPWASGDDDGVARGMDVGGIQVHSLRLPGSVAHQEVLLGTTGETLSIRHDSLDRASFMPGVLLAIRKVTSLDGLVIGLENLLEL
jgi:4-hydroxy-tetrahydrodipicolinate reductase